MSKTALASAAAAAAALRAAQRSLVVADGARKVADGLAAALAEARRRAGPAAAAP